MAAPKIWYVLARTGSNRPACQHRVAAPGDNTSLCGVFMGNWTRFHTDKPLEILLCYRCKKYPADFTRPNTH